MASDKSISASLADELFSKRPLTTMSVFGAVCIGVTLLLSKSL